ncbi:mitochondrial uncoupling protein 4C-like [Scaptodrosophila lebanonensis]|uniref:Mitochondrial uncoupling protein 4C-like n=1 Tax=Drosophila lebanonensis TaxID=7225 RepID=A0A6J2TQS4_DROLE|nr:mitochondrial uncoupling protein 4C-like [Scaptodrosophila lebanonensis]
MDEKDDRTKNLSLKPAVPPIPPPMHVAKIQPKLLFQLYINTFLGASFAELFTFPMDVVKTRLHLQGEAAQKGESGGPKRGMFGIMYGIVKEEGFKSLYSGLSAMITRNLIFNALRVVFYDVVRQEFVYYDEEGHEVLSLFRGFVAGNIAGCMAQALANPLDIIKIRMQMDGRRRFLDQPVRVKNVGRGIIDLYRQGGIINMWKGMGPSCFRAMMMTAGDTAAYDLSKRHYIRLFKIKDGILIQFMASVTAGLVASVLSTPADVVKSRIMNQPTDEKGRGLHYRNAFHCYYKLITEEGLMAMYKGFTPCWLRIGPWSVAFWTAFEQLRKWQGQTGF